MALSRLSLENFTVFDNLDIHFSKGINVLTGENGTDKTHVMKALYSRYEEHYFVRGFWQRLVSWVW
jgi:recombinational DNA repair ATPase RecF